MKTPPPSLPARLVRPGAIQGLCVLDAHGEIARLGRHAVLVGGRYGRGVDAVVGVGVRERPNRLPQRNIELD